MSAGLRGVGTGTEADTRGHDEDALGMSAPEQGREVHGAPDAVGVSEAALRRGMQLVVAGGSLAVAVLVPFLLPRYWTFVLLAAVTTMIVGLSIVVLTGFVGQISLCQATFMGVGAYASARLTGDAHLPFLIALPLAGLAAVPVGLLAGVPALRLKGLYLAIATLGFGAAVQATLFSSKTLTGGFSGVALERPTVFGISFASDLRYYFLTLVVLLLLMAFAANVKRGRSGRAFAAIRDGEVAAAASGISLARYKLTAFGLSAFIAGVGGSLFGHAMLSVNTSSFDIFHSITFVTVAIIAGVGSVGAAVFTGLMVNILPKALDRVLPGNLLLVIFSAGMLVQLAVAPDGIAGQMRRQQDAVLSWILRRRRVSGRD
ncbi:MAG: branched-chain amino acid ABC transporter permease [Actinomycetota bacterium]